jgi:hypothetical protein
MPHLLSSRWWRQRQFRDVCELLSPPWSTKIRHAIHIYVYIRIRIRTCIRMHVFHAVSSCFKVVKTIQMYACMYVCELLSPAWSKEDTACNACIHCHKYTYTYMHAYVCTPCCIFLFQGGDNNWDVCMYVCEASLPPWSKEDTASNAVHTSP